MQVWSTDQSEAGRDDHHDDERLEVVVFHQHVSVAAQFPEDASDHSVIHHAQQRRTLARARLGTTFVRVLDEHHVHLADRQTDRQTHSRRCTRLSPSRVKAVQFADTSVFGSLRRLSV